MGWSISPTAGATINDSGVATFSANGTFTITYTDSNGCTGSTTYTVSGCGGGKTNVNISLGCSLNSSNTRLTVTATADRTVDTTVTVSTTISATLNTSGGGTATSSQGLDITIDSGHSSGSNTIDADDFWDGVSYVSASSSIDSFSPSSSSSQDYIKGSGCSASGGGGTCDCSGVDMTASITATSEEGSEGAEGNYPRDCTSRMSYTAPNWVTIRFENGGIMVDHKKNTTTSQRSGTIEIKMDGTVCKTATITQQAGSGSLIHYTANVNCSSSVDASKVCVKFANEAEECGGNTYSYSTTAKSCSVSISSSDSSIYIVSPSTVTLTESSPSYDFEVRNKVVLSAVNASRDSSDLRLRLSAQGEPNCSGQIDLGIKFAYEPPTSDEAVWDTTSVNVNIDDFNGQEMDITSEIHQNLPPGSYVWPDDVSVTSHTFSDTGGDTYDCADGCTYFTF